MGVNTARVTHDTNIVITKDTWTVVPFNTETFDTHALHSTTTNNSRLTIVNAGYYHIQGGVSWDEDTAMTMRGVGIKLNGATWLALDYSNSIGEDTVNKNNTIATIYHLDADDYVELFVLHKDQSGGGHYLLCPGGYAPWFSVMASSSMLD